MISTFKSQNILTELSYAIDAMIPEGSGNLLEDTDGDGLPDIYEERGIRISNGQIVHLNPNFVDSDHDGISDFIEVGGLPKKETLLIDGETIETMVSRGGIYDTLSPDFIYVDGRVNADGSVINEKMDYVSYSDVFYEQNYQDPVSIDFEQYNLKKEVKGAARVHGAFEDELITGDFWKDMNSFNKYAGYNLLVLYGINKTRDFNAVNCFYTYISGFGGKYYGCEKSSTRDYFPANYLVNQAMPWGLNSANVMLKEHLSTVKFVAENMLNEYETDIYIALSPHAVWNGCGYVDYGEDNKEMIVHIPKNALVVATNTVAFGTFNSAQASITVHCIYDIKTGKYTMEYKYYLVDFYDFSNLQILYEEDAFGIARSYELFGRCNGTYLWERGSKGINILL